MAELTREQLAEIRDALYDGKQAWIVDGHVRVAQNASGPPLDAHARDFYDKKLGDIEDRVQHGWNFSISSDGTITGNDNHGQSMRASANPNDPQAMDFAHEAMRSGQLVKVQPDGTMTTAPANHSPGYEPNAAQIEGAIKLFDQSYASGEMTTMAAQGAVVTFDPGGSRAEEIPLAPEAHPPPETTQPPPATTTPPQPPPDTTTPPQPPPDTTTPPPAAQTDPGAVPTGQTDAASGETHHDGASGDI